jgi:hypothetical protein
MATFRMMRCAQDVPAAIVDSGKCTAGSMPRRVGMGQEDDSRRGAGAQRMTENELGHRLKFGKDVMKAGIIRCMYGLDE